MVSLSLIYFVGGCLRWVVDVEMVILIRKVHDDEKDRPADRCFTNENVNLHLSSPVRAHVVEIAIHRPPPPLDNRHLSPLIISPEVRMAVESLLRGCSMFRSGPVDFSDLDPRLAAG